MKKFRFAIALLVAGFGLLAFANGSPLPNETGAPDSIRLDDSWHLQLDTKAEWEHDNLYLPDEVDLEKMPVNPPSDGWDVLNDQNGIPITLPDTVERHYWGQSPLPVARNSNPESEVNINGSYHGVSWWYRNFFAPPLKPGEKLIISFPGARLRAEVYVNKKLVGYNLISEIPFTADATAALKPGEPNQIAVRITNPGGNLRWSDYDLFKWGGYEFPVTHNFGGIDGGVTMAVHSEVAVEDLYIANNPDPHTVTLNATVVSTGKAYHGPLALTISDHGKNVWSGAAEINVPADGQATISQTATVADAKLWDLGHPNLYQAEARIKSEEHSARVTDFGFRWFNAEDLGTNAQLVLNGRRIFVRSAISWGYWAPNGLFPDSDAVRREIDAAQTLGLNCIQTHRHFPKAAVLDGFDHAGLLRYCEPGGGSAIWSGFSSDRKVVPKGPIVPSGVGGEPVSFANRYELAKLLAMIKAYRSHPAIIVWSLNNETGGNSHNPKIWYAMEKAHALDPSRIIVLKSGFVPEGEVMGRPYITNLFYGEAATHHDSGWHDIHNEEDGGVYQDSLYQNPTNYKCYTTDTNGIAMWGELGTANSPDDDAAIVRWYQKQNTPGYDRDASEARLAAYNAFLDKYQFRSAFPTAETLFQAVGARHYFAAAHIIENARITDANDYIALTGWESTTIDNNSGLVDALRQLKSDPRLIQQANAPELLVIRPRHYVIAKGNAAVADAYIANEDDLRGDYVFHLSATMDNDATQPVYETSFPIHAEGGGTFAQLLKENISFTLPDAGALTLTVWLTDSDGKKILSRTEPMLVVDPSPVPMTNSIAVVDASQKWIPAIKKQFGATAIPFNPAAQLPNTILVNCIGDLSDVSSIFSNLLADVRSGSRLVLISTNVQEVGRFARMLDRAKIVKYMGTAGYDNTAWIGHWYFGKKHWLLSGLPSDCVWDWQYQAGKGGDGLVMDAPGLEAVVGYGKNPGPNLGLGIAIVPVRNGQIIFLAISGLADGFIKNDADSFDPVTARRLIYNALRQ